MNLTSILNATPEQLLQQASQHDLNICSHWARYQVHQFDINQFIEAVYQKYQAMSEREPGTAAWAASRERLQQLWDSVLSGSSKRVDATLYPNRGGNHQPALMEVWLKACDFWRAKYRQGDTLFCDQFNSPIRQHELFLIRLGQLQINKTKTLNNGAAAVVACVEEPAMVEPSPEPSRCQGEFLAVVEDYTMPEAAEGFLICDDEIDDWFEQCFGTAAPKVRSAAKGAGALCVAGVALALVFQCGLLIPLGIVGVAAGMALK